MSVGSNSKSERWRFIGFISLISISLLLVFAITLPFSSYQMYGNFSGQYSSSVQMVGRDEELALVRVWHFIAVYAAGLLVAGFVGSRKFLSGMWLIIAPVVLIVSIIFGYMIFYLAMPVPWIGPSGLSVFVLLTLYGYALKALPIGIVSLLVPYLIRKISLVRRKSIQKMENADG